MEDRIARLTVSASPDIKSVRPLVWKYFAGKTKLGWSLEVDPLFRGV